MSFRTRLAAFGLIVISSAGWLLSCNQKVSDYQLTDLYQIEQLLTNEPVAKSVFPPIWLDTTSQAAQSPQSAGSASPITPQDFWVEVVAHKRDIPSAPDSCRPDEFNQGDSCSNIQIAGDGRAHVRTAQISDSLVCRYHIIDQTTHEVTIKNVTYSQNWWGMMAQLGASGTVYKGWSLYAINAQLQRSFSNAPAPIVDSVVVTWNDERFISRLRVSKFPYVPLLDIPHINPGEAVNVEVFCNTASEPSIPSDAYVHLVTNGVFKHHAMIAEGNGRFSYDFYESSGRETGTCAQIVVELFHPSTLRDSNVNVFANLIWATTYRVGN